MDKQLRKNPFLGHNTRRAHIRGLECVTYASSNSIMSRQAAWRRTALDQRQSFFQGQ